MKIFFRLTCQFPFKRHPDGYEYNSIFEAGIFQYNMVLYLMKLQTLCASSVVLFLCCNRKLELFQDCILLLQIKAFYYLVRQETLTICKQLIDVLIFINEEQQVQMIGHNNKCFRLGAFVNEDIQPRPTGHPGGHS